MIWLTPRSTLFPYTTLFRSVIDPASYETAIDDDTALVAACSGYYVNGFRQELGPIVARAHAVNALVFTDAYQALGDRKSTRLNSSHGYIWYAVFCLKKKKVR